MSTPAPGGATNGVTPLDAANVQWKAGDDSRSGDLVFINRSAKLTQSFFAVPIRWSKTGAGARPALHFIEQIAVPFPLIAWDDIPSATLATESSGGMASGYPAPRSWTGSNAAANSRRAIIVQFNPQYGETVLSAGIDSVVTTVPLFSSAAFTSNGIVLIERELIGYSGISGNSLTGCTRGLNNTVAAAHTNVPIVQQVLTNPYWEGRVVTVAF